MTTTTFSSLKKNTGIYQSQVSYTNNITIEIPKNVIKLIVPEGLRRPSSLDTKSLTRFCIDSPSSGPCRKTYVAKIRAVIKKLPGFLFTGYEQSQFLAVGITTMKTMGDLMIDYFKMHPDAWKIYNKTIGSKGLTYGVHKERVLIKMSPSASVYDVDIVSAGIMYE